MSGPLVQAHCQDYSADPDICPILLSAQESVNKLASVAPGPNRVLAKDVKCLLLCQMRDINSMNRGECLGPKQAQLITMHS